MLFAVPSLMKGRDNDNYNSLGVPMNRPILIVAIYAPSPLNVHWYNLQKRFIASTTTVPHEFRVYLNGVDPASFDPDDILEISPTNEGHPIALQRVADSIWLA
jgi:hypothetical protein